MSSDVREALDAARSPGDLREALGAARVSPHDIREAVGAATGSIDDLAEVLKAMAKRIAEEQVFLLIQQRIVPLERRVEELEAKQRG